ncbi:MAG: hypothetical protein M3220_06170 [Chloroflexota bacterium]|nr:hypothetical protein [Chloroflexota bacterium]
MDEPLSPSLLMAAALLVGVGLYLIQRSRFLVPALMMRSQYLRTHLRLARGMLLFLLTLGVLFGGMGCRIIFLWFQ